VDEGKVQPLSDDDRRTLARWIDLGCPIDLDYDPASPDERGYGWMLDDNRPVLALTYPQRGENASLGRIVIGMADYYTGIDEASLSVVADFEIDGIAAGENLASKFKTASKGVLEYSLSKPIEQLKRGKLLVSVRDKQGNTTRIERTLSVRPQVSGE
jgi:hypothetical protein